MSATSVFNSTQDVQFGSGHAFQDEIIAVQSQNTLPFLQVDLQASDSADITSDGNLSIEALTVPVLPSVCHMAAAIRARKERAKSRQLAINSTLQNSMTLKPRPIQHVRFNKLEAEEVKAAHRKGFRDFSELTLDSIVLRAQDLVGSNFTRSKLRKADLRRANLQKATLGRADLAQALLQEADLAQAYLSHTNLESANLSGASLRRASLNNANLRGANLSGADLTGAHVTKEQLATARTNWATVMPDGRRRFFRRRAS